MKTYSLKQLVLLILCLVAVTELTSCQKGKEASNNFEFVADMGVGWNLGNSLDAMGTDETAWNNPVTTKALIDNIAKAGFKTLRVPVTWQFHMGKAPEYFIKKEWMLRVEEVVNYGLNNGMYVILDIHHDDEWIVPTYAQRDQVIAQLSKVWTQIAMHFNKYDDHLIFDTLNEPRLKGSPQEWKGGTSEGRQCVMAFHDVSLKAIRATGGKNKTRKVMISTYAASSTPVALEDYVLPEDKNVMVSIHNYYPYEMTLGNKGKYWGSAEDKADLDQELDRLVDRFVSKGIPVVIGEWGTQNHDNTEDRVRHAAYYVKASLQRGMCPVWWDNGYQKEFGLIDRKNLNWFFPEIVKVLTSANTLKN